MEFLLLMIVPILLAMWAQARVQSAYAAGMQVPARMTGAQAARSILDRNGLDEVPVEETGGKLSDHYDPRHRVLRLSSEVYHYPSAASVAIAAHEAGHAMQHASNYAPLMIRNLAVPLASFGSNGAYLLLLMGFMMRFQPLIWLGIALFGGVFFFQLVNLPVEFDASERAKVQLQELGIVESQEEAVVVSRVLGAAAWTYVAATLQALAIFLYYVLRFGGSGSRRE